MDDITVDEISTKLVESNLLLQNKEELMYLNDKLFKLTSKLPNKEIEILLSYKNGVDYEINNFLNRSYIIRLFQIIDNNIIFDYPYLLKVAQLFYDNLVTTITKLDKILSKNIISSEDIVVYKGITPKKHNEYSNLFGELPKTRDPKINDEITFYTYMSTTLNIDVALVFAGHNSCCLYRILIPANMKNAIYLEFHKKVGKEIYDTTKIDWQQVEVLGSEYEVLIGRGSKMRITNISKHRLSEMKEGNNIILFDMILLGFEDVELIKPKNEQIGFISL